MLLSRFLALTTIALLFFCAPLPAADAPPPDSTAAKADLAKIAADLETHYANLQKISRTMPRDRFDVQGVIELVGHDPAKLFGWVRDNTALVPYRGALRGPKGVLLDRVGNSLDRSLLLASLLQSVGFDVRLANATLSADQANELLTKIKGTNPPAAPAGAAPDPQVVEARKRVREQADRLLKMIGAPAADPNKDKAFADALADHWWVQQMQGGKWIDLDPSGLSIAKPARTVPYAPKAASIGLDAKDCQEVYFRVVIEAFRGGKLQTQQVLTQIFHPAEMLGREVNFVHYLLTPLEADDRKTDPESRKKFKAAMIALDGFLPTLRLDGNCISSASFNTAGDVNRNPQLSGAAKVSSSANKSFGGFSGGLLGGAPSKATPNSALTAEWIEYVVRIPGQPPRLIRREVFDLIGPAARAAGVKELPKFTDDQKFHRALALQGQIQVLIQPCELPQEFIGSQLMRTALADRSLWLGLAHGDNTLINQFDKIEQMLNFHDDTTPALAMVRQNLGAFASHTFIDQPNIIHARMWLEEAADQSVVGKAGIDLAATSIGSLSDDAFSARVARGVADTFAEYLVLGKQSSPTENTATIFEKSASGSTPTVVRPDDEGSLDKLGMPPDTLARAKADLASGNLLVLASPAQGRWTWWRIDAKTGQNVGVMDSGYCGGTSEYGTQLDCRYIEIDEFCMRYGHRFTMRELRNATYQQMLEWSNGTMQGFTDLMDILNEVGALTRRMTYIVG